jgi:hypothetical protein
MVSFANLEEIADASFLLDRKNSSTFLYAAFALWSIRKSQNLDILSHVALGQTRPSWAPDWSEKEAPQTFTQLTNEYQRNKLPLLFQAGAPFANICNSQPPPNPSFLPVCGVKVAQVGSIHRNKTNMLQHP